MKHIELVPFDFGVSISELVMTTELSRTPMTTRSVCEAVGAEADAVLREIAEISEHTAQLRRKVANSGPEEAGKLRRESCTGLSARQPWGPNLGHMAGARHGLDYLRENRAEGAVSGQPGSARSSSAWSRAGPSIAHLRSAGGARFRSRLHQLGVVESALVGMGETGAIAVAAAGAIRAVEFARRCPRPGVVVALVNWRDCSAGVVPGGAMLAAAEGGAPTRCRREAR